MRILCPIDRSTRDSTTLRYAKDLAKGMDGTLIIAEAIPLVRSLLKAAFSQAEGYVGAVESGLREEGFKVEGTVRKGDPAKVILSLANDFRVDLILMTTRGRSGLGKTVLGSVAHEVLANSEKPVLLLKEGLDESLSGDDTELQSAYIAAVIWNKRAKGILTQDEVIEELLRLSKSGLDQNVLYETYMTYEKTGKPVDWLDLEFQNDAIRRFLPGDAASGPASADPYPQSNVA